MSKCTLEYNLPEDQEDLDCALNGGNYKHALWEVSQEVFRPARKHGYSDARIQSLIEKLDLTVEQFKTHDVLSNDWPRDEYGPMNATDLVGLLEKLFHQVLDSNGAALD